MSQYGGSSGYGSTRSHAGPHVVNVDSEDKKFNSLRGRGRCRSEWPQFRSLRKTCKRAMLPIKENSSELKTLKPNENNSGDKEVCSNLPPTPAPRKLTSHTNKQCNAKHTYQNVPIPITPNTSSNSDNSVNSTNENIQVCLKTVSNTSGGGIFTYNKI